MNNEEKSIENKKGHAPLAGVGNSSGSFMSITLKGIILLSLGGFSGESKGLNTLANSEKATRAITEYCNKHQVAIVPVNGGLEIIPLKRKKPWWKFW